jgi:hypothetical protein
VGRGGGGWGRAVVALLVDLRSADETESCRSCRPDNLLDVLGGDLPGLVGDEMLELCWEATTYWRSARCRTGEVSRTVLPAGYDAIDATVRGAASWMAGPRDHRRGACAGPGISGGELVQVAGSPAS